MYLRGKRLLYDQDTLFDFAKATLSRLQDEELARMKEQLANMEQEAKKLQEMQVRGALACFYMRPLFAF